MLFRLLPTIKEKSVFKIKVSFFVFLKVINFFKIASKIVPQTEGKRYFVRDKLTQNVEKKKNYLFIVRFTILFN